jgi:hypothetical protein
MLTDQEEGWKPDTVYIFMLSGVSPKRVRSLTLNCSLSTKEYNYRIRADQTSLNLIKFIINNTSAYVSK